MFVRAKGRRDDDHHYKRGAFRERNSADVLYLHLIPNSRTWDFGMHHETVSNSAFRAKKIFRRYFKVCAWFSEFCLVRTIFVLGGPCNHRSQQRPKSGARIWAIMCKPGAAVLHAIIGWSPMWSGRMTSRLSLGQVVLAFFSLVSTRDCHSRKVWESTWEFWTSFYDQPKVLQHELGQWRGVRFG